MYAHEVGRPSASNRMLPFLLIIFLACGTVLTFLWLRSSNRLGPSQDAQPRTVTARGDLSELEKTNISIYESASPAVAHITSLAASGNPFSLNAQQIPKGTGSGFVWDTNGNIVTNYHVVEGAQGARVTLADHDTYDAVNVWASPENDIAVIQIRAPAAKLHPITIGSSHDLKVGQVTYAIGNPFGLDHSLTTGIVSALGREIDASDGHPIHGAIQTSAAINPGNSGGPLLDSAGRLIGMNTAILSPSGTFAGIGFAIPVDQINQIVPQLIQNGRITRPQLGVQLAEQQVAGQLGVSQGALVFRVVPNSPAAQAGLRGTRRDHAGQIQMGDVIVAMDGKAINQPQDVFNGLTNHKGGDKITLTIMRDGKKQDVQVTL